MLIIKSFLDNCTRKLGNSQVQLFVKNKILSSFVLTRRFVNSMKKIKLDLDYVYS